MEKAKEEEEIRKKEHEEKDNLNQKINLISWISWSPPHVTSREVTVSGRKYLTSGKVPRGAGPHRRWWEGREGYETTKSLTSTSYFTHQSQRKLLPYCGLSNILKYTLAPPAHHLLLALTLLYFCTQLYNSSGAGPYLPLITNSLSSTKRAKIMFFFNMCLWATDGNKLFYYKLLLFDSDSATVWPYYHLASLDGTSLKTGGNDWCLRNRERISQCLRGHL